MLIHPLDPLNKAELKQSVSIVQGHVKTEHGEDARTWYKYVTLREPAKDILKKILDLRHESRTVEPLIRQADVLVGVKVGKSTTYFEYYIALGACPSIERVVQVPQSSHVGADGEEMVAAEAALFKNEDFLHAIKDLRLPPMATVVADGWIYGSDTKDDVPRLVTFMVYYRMENDANSNHYAYPLPLYPTLKVDEDFALYDITYTPIFGGESTKTVKDLDGPFPWEMLRPHEYAHSIREGNGEYTREDLKPYRVFQPSGPSYRIEGRTVKWQKWEFHIGFNFREGPVINDVRYDGRRVFHRLSVSDMTVPYGDPRGPFHRKQAFDLGDCGAGLTANELELGCDCLGMIHYFDFDLVTAGGSPTTMKNVVCLHEQDEGILWKHTNYRTGRASLTRSRVLVVQTIITVANYEYIFAWKFDQAAAVHLETRATGILSTALILPGETSPYGTIVNPGVLATNHQHLFSLRIDPAIDGHENTIVQEDSVPMPFSAASRPANNLHGVGYTVQKTPILTAGFADAAPDKNRIFKIINPNVINQISGRPVGYKLVPAASQLMLAHPESIAYQRAEFGDHHIWVTKYRENELYSGGHYTNQSNGNAKGIKTWIARQDNVENTDVVLWHTFGLTHNPRVEDWPVMPCETHMISLKPVDFFNGSPANDVPASDQASNESTLHGGQTNGNGSHLQGSIEVEEIAKASGLNATCCTRA